MLEIVPHSALNSSKYSTNFQVGDSLSTTRIAGCFPGTVMRAEHFKVIARVTNIIVFQPARVSEAGKLKG